MFGIGFSELAIIAIVLIIVVRPEDLPSFFRKLGRLYVQVKKAYKEVADVKDEFLREMDVTAAVQDSAKAPSTPPSASPMAPPAAEPSSSTAVDAPEAQPNSNQQDAETAEDKTVPID